MSGETRFELTPRGRAALARPRGPSRTPGGAPAPADGDAEPMAYVARDRSCGHVVVAMVDTPSRRADTARELARAIRRGLLVERVTVNSLRRGDAFCPATCRRRHGGRADG